MGTMGSVLRLRECRLVGGNRGRPLAYAPQEAPLETLIYNRKSSQEARRRRRGEGNLERRGNGGDFTPF